MGQGMGMRSDGGTGPSSNPRNTVPSGGAAEVSALRQDVQQITHQLEGILQRCMAKEPPRRYPSTRDLAEALRRSEQALGAGQAVTLRLERGCTYALSDVNNRTDGANGLPSIRGEITIEPGRRNEL